MIASLGIGMQADSTAISRKTAGSPTELMNSVATLMIGLRTKSVAEAYGMSVRSRPVFKRR